MVNQLSAPRHQPSQGNLKRPLWIKATLYLFFLPVLCGSAASFVLLKNYLPSHEWLTASSFYGQLIGAFAALICIAAASAGMRYQAMETGKASSAVVRFLVLLVCMTLLYFCTIELVQRGAPAVIAIYNGSKVEHSYVVGTEGGEGSAKCRRPIYFLGLSMARICDMPFRFSEQLSKGMPVVLIGKGTAMGLFVEDFRTP